MRNDERPAPLVGCRVLVTRPAEQASSWRAALVAAGAVVIEHPTISVGPPPSWEPLDRALAQLASYDWIVFTSATAVRHVADRWPVGLDPAALGRPQIAAVGGETARALEQRHFSVALIPEDQRQEGLVAALAELSAGTRVLFPRALGGRDHLVEALTARGVQVDLVAVSQTRAVANLSAPPPFDVATFASPSALNAFLEACGPGALAGVPVVVVGATTAAAAAARGVPVVIARQPDIRAVIDAIADAMGAGTRPGRPTG